MRTLVIASLLLSAPAFADDLGNMLSKGPLVRVETDNNGKLKQATAIIDVNASAETVWKVLNDFESYRFFMPRIEKLEVTREGNDSLLDIKLNTPLVATRYTNRMSPDPATMTIKVRQVKGDLDGSTYNWKVVSLGDGRSRIFYSGLVKNYSSIAERFEDDQQTLSIGINVVSLIAATKAVKARAEQVTKQAAATPVPAP
jgi:ribosome-associated toxin RatA of RatAB toxin-antitoxin module